MVRYLEPTTLAEASDLAREHEWDGKLVAGGTALVLMLQQGLVRPDVLIGLRGLRDVDGYREIRRTAEGFHIGAGVTVEQVARDREIRLGLPSLATACRLVANVRVRNVATLAGNLAEADYASDPPAVLVSLGAQVEARNATGSRTIPVDELIADFYTTTLAVDEIVTAVRVPAPPPGAVTTYRKYTSRSSEDRPCVGVAASAAWDDTGPRTLSVVVGAAAATPQTFPEITDTAVGRELDDRTADDIAEAYAQAVEPLDDARGSAWYRRRMVRVFVRRSLDDLRTGAEQGGGLR